MLDPYDYHPYHPADAKEPEWRYGNICPNQFTEKEFEALGQLQSKVEEQLDLDEAEDAAKAMANLIGKAVTVTAYDEEHWTEEPRVMEPTGQEVEL